MFLRCTKRKKNGKEHRYWSIVEDKRVADGRTLQRHVLYLGEINDGQRAGWQNGIEAFEDDDGARPKPPRFGSRITWSPRGKIRPPWSVGSRSGFHKWRCAAPRQ